MSKLNQVKIPMDNTSFKLVKESDGLTCMSSDIAWVEWNDYGMFKKLHKQPSIGLSLILEPKRINFTWLTTTVTVIVEERDDYIKFKTKNSTYELFKL